MSHQSQKLKLAFWTREHELRRLEDDIENACAKARELFREYGVTNCGIGIQRVGVKCTYYVQHVALGNVGDLGNAAKKYDERFSTALFAVAQQIRAEALAKQQLKLELVRRAS